MQILPGIALGHLRHFLRGAGGYDISAAIAALGAKINDVVGGFDHVQIVLDNQHRVPRVHQFLQHLDELVHIRRVQAGGRLVQDIDGLSRGDSGQFRRQLHPLGFAAAVTIMVGFVVAFLLMKGVIGSDAWMGLGALCGSWLGGSGNMVAVQAALDISEADMGYALVIDSIDYSLWVMFLLWAIQLAPRFNKWTKADTKLLDEVSSKLADDAKLNTKPVSFQSLILLIGVALTVSAVGQNVGKALNGSLPFLDKATWTVLFITVLGLVAAVSPLGKVAGSTEVSNLLLYTVIALLASRASLLELADAPAWILTGFIILAIHAVLLLIFSKLFKLDMFTAAVASLANIGGTASAPVLAGSYAGSLVPVGILMALLGYVIGTPCGILVANIMKMLA